MGTNKKGWALFLSASDANEGIKKLLHKMGILLQHELLTHCKKGGGPNDWTSNSAF